MKGAAGIAAVVLGVVLSGSVWADDGFYKGRQISWILSADAGGTVLRFVQVTRTSTSAPKTHPREHGHGSFHDSHLKEAAVRQLDPRAGDISPGALRHFSARRGTVHRPFFAPLQSLPLE